MKIYGLKTCDNCRKAMKSLQKADLVDVRETPVPGHVLDAALEKFGGALLNTRSTTWRNLSQAERSGQPLELIAAYPALMKRPLIESDGELFLGWTPDTRSALGVA